MSVKSDKRDSSNNIFLSYAYDLYDIVYEIKNGKIQPNIKKIWVADSAEFTRKKLEYYPEVEEQYKKILTYADILKSTPPSFDTLWDFCEFIRISEKAFFYHNDPSEDLYVEMDMDKPMDPRKLRISKPTKEAEIRLTLEHFVYDSNMIIIEVVRDYGRNMRNTYKVVDGDLPFDDSSDAYLINEVNFELEKSIETTFLYIIEQILKEGGVKNYGLSK